MAFEWDEAKRAANLQDHGVDFEDATLIFAGPVIEADDTRVDISAWRLDDDGRKRYETILSRRP